MKNEKVIITEYGKIIIKTVPDGDVLYIVAEMNEFKLVIGEVRPNNTYCLGFNKNTGWFIPYSNICPSTKKLLLSIVFPNDDYSIIIHTYVVCKEGLYQLYKEIIEGENFKFIPHTEALYMYYYNTEFNVSARKKFQFGYYCPEVESKIISKEEYDSIDNNYS